MILHVDQHVIDINLEKISIVLLCNLRDNTCDIMAMYVHLWLGTRLVPILSFSMLLAEKQESSFSM